MEKLKLLLNESNQLYQIADHLIFSTYPAVGEVKLLIAATEKLYNAILKGIEAVLYYERIYKRVPVIREDHATELMIFKEKCMRRYNIDRSVISLLIELEEFMEARKSSSMEFVRKDKFVICNPMYRMNILNIRKVKGYMAQGRLFLDKVNQVVKVR